MNSVDQFAKNLNKLIEDRDDRKPSPKDDQVTVTKVEGDTVWVHFPGGVDETPVQKTMDAKVGDTITVRRAEGKAWITGNSTRPPTDDSTANYAVDLSTNVKKDVTVLNTVVAENIEATNARFGNVEADTAKIHDLTADQLTATVGYIGDLTADNISASDISADHATIGDLDVNYAKVNAANIDSAAIRNAWVDKIMVQTGLLAYSSQVYTLDAIEVNAANITAGTLDVNRLIVTVGEGSSAQKYLVNIDPSTGTPSYEKLDGNIVEPRTITANKIVANSITTDEITVNNLVGTSGWINLHEGKFFYGDGASFASATNAISWNGSKLQIKADEFLLSTGQTIQDSIESVENWFYSVPPTTSNPPASSWTTTNLKEQHLRDIYFDTTSGKSYRWSKDNNVYSWVEIEDVELSALAKDLHDNYPPRSEFTVAPDQIQSTVSAAQTAATNAANSATDTKLQSYYTKTQTDSAITQKAGEITASVSSTYETKSDATNKLNTAKGYTDSEISSAKAEIKVTTDGISTEVSKVSSVKYFDAYGDGWTLANIKIWAAEGYSDTWTLKTSNESLRIGDTIYLKAKDTTRDCYVYIKLTVTAKPGTTGITATSHGYEDVLPVETIKSTINQSSDSVKIKANHIEIDGTATFNAIKSNTDSAYDAKGAAQTAVDGIEVGGRNILLNTGNASEHYGAITRASFSPTWTTGVSVSEWSTNEGLRIVGSGATDTIPIIFGGADNCLSTASRASIAGQSYVYSIYIKNNHSTNRIGVQANLSGANTVYIAPNEAKRCISYGVGNGTSYVQINIRTDNNDDAVDITIWHPQIEYGTKATEWSPAPEDVQAEIDAKKSIHTLLPLGGETSSKAPYQTIVFWSADGHVDYWNVTSTNGVKVGDTVRVGYYVEDMGSAGNRPLVYVVGTVDEIRSSTRIKMTSHGLDTTVIDGGNILTNSITANQLDTNQINNSGVLNTGALTVGAREAVLNSNIVIGGRNLFINGKMSRSVYVTNYGGLAGSVNCVTSAFIPVNGGDSVILQNWENDASRSDWWAMAFYTAATPDSGTSNSSFIDGSCHSAFFNNGYKAVSYEAPSNAKFVRVSRQFTGLGIGSTWNNGDNGNNVKVEIGTNPTDFTLAPEDSKKIHNLSSTYSISYETARRWSAEGYDAGSWEVSSTSGVDIGDTVRIKCTLSDMNDAVIYIQGTVTNVTSATTLRMISHGFDTTVIDGGMILTGTVAANRIDAANLSIGGSQLTGTVPMARLTSEAQKAIQDQGIKILNTSYSTAYSNLIIWSSKSADTYSINTSETPITNIGAGNTVALRCWDSTHQKYVYILGYVYEVASSTQIKVYPKGFYDPDISSYITKIGSDGIKVSDGINTTNYAQIDSNGMNIYKGNTSVAEYGDTVRIGKLSGARAVTTSTGLDIYNSSNEKKASYGATQYIYGGNGTYPYVGVNGSGAGIYQSNTQKTIMTSAGLLVYSGDATDSVASFGTTARVGKLGKKNIQITNTNFNVYDDDGSIPFQVSTATSVKTEKYGIAWYMGASSSYQTQAYLKGVIVNNTVSVGVATSGVPTASNTITLTNLGTEYTITVSGVKYTFTRYTDSIFYKIENTNSAKRSCLVSFTQSYRETYVKENTHIFGVRYQTVSIEDVTGTCGGISAYTYGGIVQLVLTVYKGSSVSNGGLIYKGNLGNVAPIERCYMAGFVSGVKDVVGYISPEGNVLVYNVSGGSLSTTSSTPAELSATYIMAQ